jgi:calcineurin-like phosphoesterase family protein
MKNSIQHIEVIYLEKTRNGMESLVGLSQMTYLIYGPKMNNIFFTVDTHFNHTNVIKYCSRPFKTVEEMNEVLIANWNSKIGKNDLVYHLGDFGFGDLINIINRLNGKIILISGSHDKSAWLIKDKLHEIVKGYLEVNIREYSIILCHYAMRVWPKSHYGSWHLYGHSHGNLPNFYIQGDERYSCSNCGSNYDVATGKSFDVGVDGHNFTPWSFEEIVKEMKNKPDNFNLVKKEG